jgi:bifunctional non-homologous end joining protein LigD
MPGEAADAFPGFIPPMLATLARALPPDEAEWTAEFKWDGMRASAYMRNGRAWFRSRTGRDITSSYPELAAIAVAAGRRSLILDGEIVAFRDNRPDFSALQRRMHVTRPNPGLLAAVPVTFVAFDLIQAGTRSLLRNPYRQRRAVLDGLGLQAPGVQVPPAFPGEAAVVVAASAAQGFEGVILKRPGSVYEPGRRSSAWLKIKHVRTTDIVVAGWLPGSGYHSRLAGSLVAGVQGPAGLEYCGQVGSGFTETGRQEITRRLRELEQPQSPFAAAVPQGTARLAHWVKPVLVGEVSYSEWTPGGRLRHPVWRGVRTDADPTLVHRT